MLSKGHRRVFEESESASSLSESGMSSWKREGLGVSALGV